jgi:hypothetical protein
MVKEVMRFVVLSAVSMKFAVSCDMTPCWSVFFFCPEDGDRLFLRNACKLTANYWASRNRSEEYSLTGSYYGELRLFYRSY